MKRALSFFVSFAILTAVIALPALIFAGSSGGTSGGAGVTDGDKGDVTVADSGATWTVDANAIELGTDTTGGYAASATEGGAATTATALAANGGNCTVGNYPLGMDASGAAESCTALPAAGVGGSTGAADDKLLCSDGTGGSTLGVCTVGDIDNLRLDGNTLSSTSGAVNITAQGNTGVVITAAGSGRSLLTGGNQNGVGFGSLGAATGLMIDTFSGGRLYLSRDFHILWNSVDQSGAQSDGKDTGLIRNAAGVIRATDGSTGIRGFLGGGAAVASATALPVLTGSVVHVTGTTTITSITSTNFQSGAIVTLIFDGVLTFTDGNNLKLAGDFVTTADDTITIAYDGSNWYEQSRSVN